MRHLLLKTYNWNSYVERIRITLQGHDQCDSSGCQRDNSEILMHSTLKYIHKHSLEIKFNMEIQNN